MSSLPITRTQALEYLKQQNPETSNLNHYLESEAIMRRVALHLNQDQDYWAMLGLLHDIDWEATKHEPSKHISLAPKMLSDLGFDQEFIDIVITHVYGFEEIPEYLDKKRTKPIEHALAASETMTGIVYAYALMRDKNISTMEVKGLKKKFKDKKFAENCNREIIREIELTGIPLDEFFQIAIDAIKEIKDDIGLN